MEKSLNESFCALIGSKGIGPKLLSELFVIPNSTTRKWSSGNSLPPDYVKKLIMEALFTKFSNGELERSILKGKAVSVFMDRHFNGHW